MAGEDVIARVTLGEQIEEVKREVRMRQKVYARLVGEKKMTTAEATARTCAMAAVQRTLEKVRDAP